jgi:hypothetical protein
MNTRSLPARDAAVADKQNVIGFLAAISGLLAVMYGASRTTDILWLTITGVYLFLVGLVLWAIALDTYRGKPATRRIIPAGDPVAFTSLGIAFVAFVATLVCQAKHFATGTEVSTTIMILTVVTAIYELCFAPTKEELQQTPGSSEPIPAETPVTR